MRKYFLTMLVLLTYAAGIGAQAPNDNMLRLAFSGTGTPVETEHSLLGTRITFSEDGRKMNFTTNEATVVYDMGMVSGMSHHNGTPTITLSTTQNPLNASEYVTTFHSGLEAYTIPDGVTAYTAEVNSDQTAVILTAIEGGVLPQGEAVLLYTDVAGAITMNTVVSSVVASETNQLLGTDIRDLTPANCMALNSAAGAFQHYTGEYFPANKAYLLSNAPAPLRIGFSAGQTDTATGMESDSEQIKAQKVLRNGQLFILREGRVFDANGVELR